MSTTCRAGSPRGGGFSIRFRHGGCRGKRSKKEEEEVGSMRLVAGVTAWRLLSVVVRGGWAGSRDFWFLWMACIDTQR